MNTKEKWVYFTTTEIATANSETIHLMEMSAQEQFTGSILIATDMTYGADIYLAHRMAREGDLTRAPAYSPWVLEWLDTSAPYKSITKLLSNTAEAPKLPLDPLYNGSTHAFANTTSTAIGKGELLEVNWDYKKPRVWTLFAHPKVAGGGDPDVPIGTVARFLLKWSVQE